MTGAEEPAPEETEPVPPEERRSPYVEAAQLLALVVILVVAVVAMLTDSDLDLMVVGAIVALGLGLQDWPKMFGGRDR